jgi:hypothetical protein
MRKGPFLSKRFLHPCCSWFWWREPSASTAPGAGGSRPSSRSETGRSRRFAARRPSLYLSLVCCALSVSGLLALEQSAPGTQDEMLRPLRAKGWVEASAPPCPEPTAGFYELESEDENVEFYATGTGRFLAPRPEPWPDAPAVCRPISHPTFIQEVQ